MNIAWTDTNKSGGGIKMSTITQETRLESFEQIQIQGQINDRHSQCIKGLQELGSGTANELASYLYNIGVTPYFSRNFVHPRLNELVAMDKVEIIGKKKDRISQRMCAIYTIKIIN